MKESFKKMFDLNQNLSQEKKIEFIGIDAPNYLGSIIKALGHLFLNKIPSGDIKPFIDSIQTLNRYPVYHFWREIKTYNQNFLTYISTQYKLHKPALAEFLGEDYFHFVQVVESRASHFRPGDRNRDMFLNTVRIFKHLPIKSSLFVFGSSHVGKDARGSLANRILVDRTSPFVGHVKVVVGTHYENTKSFYSGKEVVIHQSILDYEFKKNRETVRSSITNDIECSVSIHNTRLISALNPLHSTFDYLLLVEGGRPIQDLRKQFLSK